MRHAAAGGDGLIVRLTGEGRWLLPSEAEREVRQLDNAVTLAVDEVREDEYQRLLFGLRAFVRRHGELIEEGDCAGAADVTVPPPELSLDSAVDALYEGRGLEAG